MKKIILLIVGMMALSGCSATNGLVSKSDVENLNYEDMDSMLKKQKNISYIPDDVKEFLSKIEEANKNHMESQYGYLDIRSSIMGYYNGSEGELLHEIYTSDDMSEEEEVEFNKLVDVLDQTISKGIKSYIDKNKDSELEDSMYTKIGRVWVFINPRDVYDNPQYDIPEDTGSGNNITLVIKVKDIRDKEYKKIVDNVVSDELILNSINIGRNVGFIELSNMEQKNSIVYRLTKPAISYQLFMEDKDINKVRLSVQSKAGDQIDDDFISLSNISNQLEFTMDDRKQLEEIRSLLKENKQEKKLLTSDKFNFSYKNLESKNSVYGPRENTNLTEVIIEKK